MVMYFTFSASEESLYGERMHSQRIDRYLTILQCISIFFVVIWLMFVNLILFKDYAYICIATFDLYQAYILLLTKVEINKNKNCHISRWLMYFYVSVH